MNLRVKFFCDPFLEMQEAYEAVDKDVPDAYDYDRLLELLRRTIGKYKYIMLEFDTDESTVRLIMKEEQK